MISLACIAFLTACGGTSSEGFLAEPQSTDLSLQEASKSKRRSPSGAVTSLLTNTTNGSTSASTTTQTSTQTNATQTNASVNTIQVSATSISGIIQPSIPISAGTTVSNPILFVTQVPGMGDFASRASTFANHLSSIDRVPRGGDLMIRYTDGTLRNLTKEAGFGTEGLQVGVNAIAVREPSMHWDGKKAVFSMIVGGPSRQYDSGAQYKWQIYEVSGLMKGESVTIRKVSAQPADYNNVSPIYGTDEKIIFTSDRPRGGEAHLYPQLDEYESTPTNTGLWSLDRTTPTLKLLNHAPSGAFSPSIDSYGRVVFSRWDHLQRDQQADAERAGTRNHGTVTYSDESPSASKVGIIEEKFPEPRQLSTSRYGDVNPHTFNSFTPWQINEDGTDEVTLNHLGRHEFNSYIPRSFLSDTALADYSRSELRTNKLMLNGSAGILQIREDTARLGTYFAIYGREFGQLGSNQIVRFNGGVSDNPQKMAFEQITPPEQENFNTFRTPGGRYRNPLPLANGTLIASHTPTEEAIPANIKVMRLRVLSPGVSGFYEPGAYLNPEIRKTLSWWSPDRFVSYDGPLWEIEAVEVVARPRPIQRKAPAIEAPEASVFNEEQVNEADLRAWLIKNQLALIITRNQTRRDAADLSQPFNLQVPGGTKTLSIDRPGKVYDISNFQIFQADSIRGYNAPGRRVLAQPIKGFQEKNTPNALGPESSVKIASDGSSAAFVPASRALVWQTTDSVGTPIVRERVWVTFQPGEVRTCAGCHGANDKDQAGLTVPQNKPEALRDLMRLWKALPK